MKKGVVLFILILSFTSCSTKIDLDISGDLSVTHFYKIKDYVNNIELKQNVLRENSPKYNIFLYWFNFNKNSWSESLLSYNGQTLLINGQGFEFKLFDKFVVLNYKKPSGEYQQFTKQIESEDYKTLKKMFIEFVQNGA